MSENETDQEIEEQEPENNDEAKDSSETYQGIDQNVVKKIEENTTQLFQKFDCSVYARADYILDKLGVPYFLEMNTLPGMTSTSLVPKSAYARGQRFQKLIRYIIELSL